MKGLKKISPVFFAAILAVPVFFSDSCKKKDTPPTAIITVLDSIFQTPIPDATVTLYLNQTSKVTGAPAIPPNPDTKITDSRGQVTFVLKNEASYFVRVTTSISATIDSAILIRFKKNEVTPVTILYNP